MFWPRCGLVGIVVCVLIGSQSVFSNPVDHVQETIQKWIDTNRVIGETRREWASEQELMKQESSLLESEIASLEDKLQQLQRINEASSEEEELLLSRRERLVVLLERIEERVVELEKRLRRLLPAFPQPLLDRLGPSVATLEVGETRTGHRYTSSRLQAIVAILTEAEKFNLNLTLTYETRLLEGGAERQMRVLYWGLAGAYAVDGSGEQAQIGSPSLDGWQWEDRSEFAEQIRSLIEVNGGGTDAVFSEVPVIVQEVTSE